MRITLMCLLSNPSAYKKLQNAITQAVNSGRVSSPISFAEAKEIPYLKASLTPHLAI